MITQIFGTTGTGKSANLARIVEETYYKRGDIMLEMCCEQIKADNDKFGLNCPLPDKPPIFVGPFLDVKFEVDFEEFFEPYFLSPYHIGIAEEGKDVYPVQFLPPYSLLIIPEAQRYYDARQSGTFPTRVSAFYEKHRHQHIDIILESQRPDLIDLNIRRLTHLFIEMRGVDNEENFAGRVESTTWRTREFTSWNSVNDYINGKETDDYTDKPIHHNGNIFEVYNSHACAKEFFPKVKNGNTSYDFLRSYSETMENGFPNGYEEYYKLSEPKGYRSKKTT